MIINCFRCGKPIESANPTNADYIRAADTIMKEEREVIVAVHHNTGTLATLARADETEEYSDSMQVQITVAGDGKFEVGETVSKRDFEFDNRLLKAAGLTEAQATTSVTATRSKYPGLQIDDADYSQTVTESLQAAHKIANLIRVEPDMREVEVQKTGIICPDCYLETDDVIWGIHKEKL